jgi:hypothetical protein
LLDITASICVIKIILILTDLKIKRGNLLATVNVITSYKNLGLFLFKLIIGQGRGFVPTDWDCIFQAIKILDYMVCNTEEQYRNQFAKHLSIIYSIQKWNCKMESSVLFSITIKVYKNVKLSHPARLKVTC